MLCNCHTRVFLARHVFLWRCMPACRSFTFTYETQSTISLPLLTFVCHLEICHNNLFGKPYAQEFMFLFEKIKPYTNHTFMIIHENVRKKCWKTFDQRQLPIRGVITYFIRNCDKDLFSVRKNYCCLMY